MSTAVRIRLCSVLTVEAGDRTLTGRDLGSRKARTLLALLAAERGSTVTVDRVADALWPCHPPADPAANVATLVSRTRRVLGSGVLTGTGRAYGLATNGCILDLDEAAGLAQEAQHCLAFGEDALAASAARHALALVGRSPALPDEPDADWVLRVRHRVDDVRRDARHALASAAIATDPREAEVTALDALEADPFDEQAARELIRARMAMGMAVQALAAYDEIAARLREDLGIDPAPETQQLQLSILRGQLPEHKVTAPERESELEILSRAWATVAAGSGGLMVIRGEPGSRLIDEWAPNPTDERVLVVVIVDD